MRMLEVLVIAIAFYMIGFIWRAGGWRGDAPRLGIDNPKMVRCVDGREHRQRAAGVLTGSEAPYAAAYDYDLGRRHADDALHSELRMAGGLCGQARSTAKRLRSASEQ